MSTIGTFIQALLSAGLVVYALPYLAIELRETIQEFKEDKK